MVCFNCRSKNWHIAMVCINKKLKAIVQICSPDKLTSFSFFSFGTESMSHKYRELIIDSLKIITIRKYKKHINVSNVWGAFEINFAFSGNHRTIAFHIHNKHLENMNLDSQLKRKINRNQNRVKECTSDISCPTLRT